MAYLTKPGLAKFAGFYQDGRGADMHPPIFEMEDNLVYTKITVKHFVPSDTGPGADGKPVIKALEGVKEEYIGLFGRFWKR